MVNNMRRSKTARLSVRITKHVPEFSRRRSIGSAGINLIRLVTRPVHGLVASMAMSKFWGLVSPTKRLVP